VCKILEITPNNLAKDLLPTRVLAVGAIGTGNLDSGHSRSRLSLALEVTCVPI
jgi:hypothetical protein